MAFQPVAFQPNFQQDVAPPSSLEGELSLILVEGLSVGSGLSSAKLEAYYVGKVKQI
jgi:hypothetical protein